jgi:hypothetical protein
VETATAAAAQAKRDDSGGDNHYLIFTMETKYTMQSRIKGNHQIDKVSGESSPVQAASAVAPVIT